MKTQLFAEQSTALAAACRTPGRFERRFAIILRGIVTSNWILYLLVSLFVGGSLFASLYTGAWHWFQRSGALMVSGGAVLSTQRALAVILDGMAGEPGPRLDSPGTARNLHELRTCVCGFVLVAMGTLIWAYGDLLGCMLEWSLACVAGSGSSLS